LIKFDSDLWQVGGFLPVLQFPPPIKLTARYNRNIVENGVKNHNTHALKPVDFHILFTCRIRIYVILNTCLSFFSSIFFCTGFKAWVLWCFTPLSTIFRLYLAVNFIGGGNRSTGRKPPTCHESLSNFIK
jgi:hypothetical protein